MKKIKRGFLSLEMEVKVIFITSLSLIISCLLPWFVTQNYINYTQETQNAFSGLLSAHGYTVFLLTLLIILLIVLPFYRVRLPRSLPPTKVIYLAVFSVNTLVVALAILTYMKYSLVDNRADIGFGIYLSFFSSFLGLTFAILNFKNDGKEELVVARKAPHVSEGEKVQRLNL